VEQTLDIVDRAYIMFDGQVKVSGTVRELVFDETVSRVYLGPTLTARLRERFLRERGGADDALPATPFDPPTVAPESEPTSASDEAPPDPGGEVSSP
jgi:hypothetical protein